MPFTPINGSVNGDVQSLYLIAEDQADIPLPESSRGTKRDAEDAGLMNSPRYTV